jgi:hypothetical protein
MMDKQLQQLESLNRAKNGDSLANIPAIISGFIAKGINPSDIIPRENVFTYDAWLALGRQVRKGEKGVKCVSYRDNEKTNKKFFCRVAVFHISQTSPIQ